MFIENELGQQAKIGINGRVYVRSQEIIDFDNNIKNYVLENPVVKYRELSDLLGVSKSKIINSVHRLQESGELKIKRKSFVQKVGKHVEKRDAIKNHINEYVNEIGDGEPADVTYLLTTLSGTGIITSEDTVRRILKDMKIATTLKPHLEVKNQIDEFNMYISKKEEVNPDSEDCQDEFLDEDFKSSDRYFEVREGLILDLLVNNTPKDEIVELTHIDEKTLKDIVRKLRQKGKLHSPPRPDASGK